jgi:hypothetical protein
MKWYDETEPVNAMQYIVRCRKLKMALRTVDNGA